MSKATHPDTILVSSMNGTPLDESHGGPLRVLVPGWVGIHSVKWLKEIRLESYAAIGKSMETQYQVPDAEGGSMMITHYPVTSLISSVPSGDQVSRNDEICGYAFSGAGAIESVEISFDDRPWMQTKLEHSFSPYSWSRWSAQLDLEKGVHTARVRASDEVGRTQPENPLENDGGYLFNCIRQVTFTVEK